LRRTGRPLKTPWKHAGLTAAVTPRIVYARNIAQSLQFAQKRKRDAAFTALSLVIKDKTNAYIIVPENLHKPLTQACGIVVASPRQADAKTVLDFVKSSPAAAIWRRNGYMVVLPAVKPAPGRGQGPSRSRSLAKSMSPQALGGLTNMDWSRCGCR